MRTWSRWFAPAVLAAGLGFSAMVPTPVHAQDSLLRVRVDIGDVAFRSGQPYYRYGNYGNHDRLIIGRDRYGRPVYYRTMPHYQYNHNNTDYNVRHRAPYGNAYGYYAKPRHTRQVKCNRHGKCQVEYYDPRYDRNYDRYDDNDRRWNGRHWNSRRGHEDDYD